MAGTKSARTSTIGMPHSAGEHCYVRESKSPVSSTGLFERLPGLIPNCTNESTLHHADIRLRELEADNCTMVNQA
jgi:hypothetical protein